MDFTQKTVLQEIARENGFRDPELSFEAGSKKGDNFVGELFRCTVTDKSDPSRHLQWMVKRPPANEVHRARFKADVFFATEAHMYKNVLPAFAQYLREKGLLGEKDPFPGTARNYGARVDEKEDMVIVMEDLGRLGFVMQDRNVGLDEQHCRAVLQKLATLHAASVALQKENPERHEKLVAQVKETVFVGTISPSYAAAFDTARRLVEERFPEGSIVRERFQAFFVNHAEILTNCAKRNSTLNCVNHGDLWTNNLLFKYKAGSSVPEEVCFVDFQISRMASPILDLSYFFCLCTRRDTRKSFQALVKVYYDSLLERLTALGHKADSIVPWDVFQQELRKYFLFGLGNAIRVLPFVLMDEEGLKDLQKLFEKPMTAQGSFVTPKNMDNLKTTLCDLIEDLVDFGLL